MKGGLLLAGALSVALAGCAARAHAGVAIDSGVIVAQPAPDQGQDRVWVCHRGRWQEVAAPAAEAHDRHGDRVSRSAQRSREAC